MQMAHAGSRVSAVNNLIISSGFDGRPEINKICSINDWLSQKALHMDEQDKWTYPMYVSLLQDCTSLANLSKGKRVHAHLVKTNIEHTIYVENIVLNMYMKCGSMEDACHVFEKQSGHNVFTWTIMIAGYVKYGCDNKAFELFRQMKQASLEPNKVTFASVIGASANTTALEQGKWLHAYAIKTQCDLDTFLGNAIIDMYAKCGCICAARQAFNMIPMQNVVSWTALISGYAKQGLVNDAIELFQQMQRRGMGADKMTIVSVLNACARAASLEQGQKIHTYLISSGCKLDVFTGSALVDMYIKCGKLKEAVEVFNEMPQKNLVTWTTMFTGYVQHGNFKEALKLHRQMQWEQKLDPDKVMFINMLNTSATLAALEHGKQLHANVVKSQFKSDAWVNNAVIGMYANCGSMQEALQVFNGMVAVDEVSWSIMITASAQYGDGKSALKLLNQMQQVGKRPDNITFISILSACSHGGLVDEGHQYFHAMIGDYGIMPNQDHFACVVDILGRAGHLTEAEDFVKMMPFEPVSAIWIGFLSACRLHGHMDLGEQAVKCVFRLDPDNYAAFVLLSNIYAAAGRWKDKARLRKIMEDRGLDMYL